MDTSTEASRSWNHIGAIIVDATLQRRQNYNETIRPRVVDLMAEWPDAATMRNPRGCGRRRRMNQRG